MSYNNLHKTRARNAAKAIRARLAREQPDAGVELIRHWPKLGKTSGTVAAYIPIGTEIDIRPLTDALADAGHTICLPAITRPATALSFRKWQKGDRLKPGPYGTSEPVRTSPLCTPDIVLVPLLAYSRDGHRLGYGGGYYDRTLAELRQRGKVFACGVAYSGQEVPTLPVTKTDQKLDAVLTDTGFKRFE